MEQIEVLIVGAGPAGLTLGLSLAKQKIHSLILEKESGVGDDPRGVYLAHDAVRILWDLGIGNRMKEIGHEIPHVNFHQSSFANPPYYQMDSTGDAAGQTVPNGILQIQPNLERALRDLVALSEYCNLRCNCTVNTCEKTDNALIVGYSSVDIRENKIKCLYLVGADGKRGVVRKHFLEGSAGIRQQNASYRYDGTWVAANLRINPPTMESHPSFRLWPLGFAPEQVYDLFWPVGWHFACPPGKATATGRFGPHSAHYWRHEFEQDDWNDDMDAEALLWEHITPMITLSEDASGNTFPCGPVTFPRECVEVLRCRPFRFTHKVVNRWYDEQTILIGDAAHVFPPFGGQGIASGVRDAYQLGWRLALLCRLPNKDDELSRAILSAWAAERTSSVTEAAAFTKINGQLCNGTEPMSFRIFRFLDGLIKAIPFIPKLPSPVTVQERAGFQAVPNGFFSGRFGGGGKIAQFWVQRQGQVPVLSDTTLRPEIGIMTLLIIDDSASIDRTAENGRDVVIGSEVPSVVLSDASFVLLTRDVPSIQTSKSYHFCPKESLNVASGYDSTEFFSRFRQQTKYVLMRPDMYIYGMAADEKELSQCLEELMRKLRG